MKTDKFRPIGHRTSFQKFVELGGAYIRLTILLCIIKQVSLAVEGGAEVAASEKLSKAFWAVLSIAKHYALLCRVNEGEISVTRSLKLLCC